MRRTAFPGPWLIVSGVAAALALTTLHAQQGGGAAIAIDADDIAGVVTGRSGPEAGVWVIAETAELGTKFSRTVVTDDQGRYLIPDLPKANYQVWVRGYGLVDSKRVPGVPGKSINLTAVTAPTPRAAAAIYPAGYWLSLLKVPEKSEFGTPGSGINPAIKDQGDWMRMIKSGGCTACHQLGTRGTRELLPALGTFPNSRMAWERRIQSGQAGAQMFATINQLGKTRAIDLFADWTDRIKAGEVPQAPPRPKGLERNVVITEWDWAEPQVYLHDLIGTD